MTSPGPATRRQAAAAVVALLLAGSGLLLLAGPPADVPARPSGGVVPPAGPVPAPVADPEPEPETESQSSPEPEFGPEPEPEQPVASGRRRVAGRVLDHDGRPASFALLRWSRGDEEDTTDAREDGSFTLDVPVDVRELEVAPFEDARRARFALDPAGGSAVELRLEQAADLDVQLAPDSAEELPGTTSTRAMLVAEVAPDDWAPGLYQLDAYEYSDWALERSVQLRGLPPGRYRLLVWRQGSDPVTREFHRSGVGEAAVELRLGENRAVVRLAAQATLTGTLTRPNGRSQGAFVRAIPLDVTRALFDHPQVLWSFGGGYGLPEYHVELPPGRWRLVAWVRGERLAAADQIVEVAPGEARRCDLTLPAERHLVVRWEPPLEDGAELLYSGPLGFLAEKVLEPERLRLRGLPPGGSVYLLARGERLGALARVQVGPAETTVAVEPLAGADLTILPAAPGQTVALLPAWPETPLCTFSGHVGSHETTGLDFEPVPNPLQATTDAQGTAHLERVPAGRYRVQVAGRCLAERLELRPGVRVARTLRR